MLTGDNQRTAEAIAHEGINIDSVIQEPNMAKDRLSFVITLEPTLETTVQRAVEAIIRRLGKASSAAICELQPGAP